MMEYMTAEVLELARIETFNNKKKVITPRFINLAVQTDDELNKFFKNVTIAGAGVVPFIHENLLKKPPTRKRW
jgi:histone H2A